MAARKFQSCWATEGELNKEVAWADSGEIPGKTKKWPGLTVERFQEISDPSTFLIRTQIVFILASQNFSQ